MSGITSEEPKIAKPKPVPVYFFQGVLIYFYKISNRFPTKPLLNCDSETGTISILCDGESAQNYKKFKLLNYPIFIICLGACTYCICKPPHITNFMYAIFLGTGSCLQFVYIFIIDNYSKDIKIAFENMQTMVDKLNRNGVKPTPSRNKSKSVEINDVTSINWHHLSLLWKYGYLSLSFFMVVIMNSVGIYINIDPFFAIRILAFGKKENILHELFRGIELVYALITVSEFMRLHGLFETLFLYWFELQSKCLRGMGKQLRSRNFFVMYSQFRICSRILEDALYSFSYSTMAALFAIQVACNVLTVNFAKMLPPGINCVAAGISGVTFFVTVVLLHSMANCHGMTERLILFRRRLLRTSPEERTGIRSRGGQKIESKVLKSIRPVSTKCGSFYEVKYESVFTYFNGIFQRTVDVVLLTRRY